MRLIVKPDGTTERSGNENIERATVVRHSDNTTTFEVVAGHDDEESRSSLDPWPRLALNNGTYDGYAAEWQHN